MSFDSLLLATSFLAGLLTILAPCVLPLLPVIVGGAAGSRNKWYPFILVISLSLSVILFTLLLKFSQLLIDIPQMVWTSISGGVVFFFGLIWLFPKTWDTISNKLNLLGTSQKNLAKASKIESNWGAVVMGAALGPVFSSCSPTYFVILATVLPVSFGVGLLYLLIYGLGLALMLGLIAFFGQKLTHKLGWAANPEGWFKRILGILLILVGLAVMTGVDKKIETAILDTGLGVTTLEKDLLDQTVDDMSEKMDKKFEIPADTTGLPKLFVAPELEGVQNWINTMPIKSMEELKGKVVLIDFWTYSCINCLRTLPYLESWHEKYAKEGLVIIGVHAPEFQFEQKLENVQQAVTEEGISYPVVQDNDFKLWNAYSNRYWPAKYLIDKNGFVRYAHAGEGAYSETEQNITKLLQTKMITSTVDTTPVEFEKIQTPETYIGLARRENFVEDSEAELQNMQWTLKGEWEVNDERAMNKTGGESIKMKFTAAKANLVISGTGTATVLVDGQKASTADVKEGVLQINGAKLYELADFKGNYQMHEIEVIFDQPSIEIFAWTFG